ncbi:integrase [Solibacillus sp. R5-41]|uniref:tyrosine-type recombinase/integrase n=1 Tax=Solibacillus sp. R5-41 TaxID=2048654 RepID=UPI000C129066|nr:tyrosine-type recombinase/integrase [Solibacillus sp. R5-41]ATP40848.1 integrase [Solibacillus sp. R5-41]
MTNHEKKYWISTHEAIPIQTRKILNEYLLSLKLANKAEATISKYRSLLERFCSECLVALDLLTSEDVLKWVNKFSVGKKETTVIIVLSILSSFFKFCLEEDYLEKMLMKKRWGPKVPQPLPKFLTEQEYARVKMAAERLPLRDRALVLFLFSSGCRRSEVAQLLIQDVDLERRTVVVQGKGKKFRQVHFSEECALIIKDYLWTRSGDVKEPLFMNIYGQPLQQNGIYKITTKLGKLAGLEQSLHPHCCRHTFATNMLARGAELEFIADEMGHTNLNTTRVYARIPTEDIMLAYQNIMG